MCTVAAAGLIVTLYSAYYQKESIENQGDYDEGVAKYNARVAENNAEKARAKGTEAENAQREKTAQLLARQRAELGAANVSLESGSALQLQEDTVALGEADALRIRSNTDDQYDALINQTSLLEADAVNAQTAASNRATGSLLTNASSVANSRVADKWFTPSSSAKGTQNA